MIRLIKAFIFSGDRMIFVFLTISTFAFAQSSDDEKVYPVVEELYEIEVLLSLEQSNQLSIWYSKRSEETYLGQPVNVQIYGSNLRIDASFTPYKMKNEGLILVAQGQIWLSSNSNHPAQYVSTYRSMPISSGEKIFFYPLGISNEIKGEVIVKLQVGLIASKK